MPIIKGKVVPDSIVYTDGFKSYDVLDVSEVKHERINPDQELVDDAGKHINGIENFWNQAKRILRKYNGIPRNRGTTSSCSSRSASSASTGVVAPATGLCPSTTVVPRSNYGCSNVGLERRG